MREQYILRVKKELHIPRKAKKEVIRDLNEIFTSALENGETEQQVINRLGTPKEFAESTAEQLGIDIPALHKQRRIVSIAVALIGAIFAFVIYSTIRAGNLEAGTIGQADAMTNIKIDGGFGVDISLIFLAIGIVAIVMAVIQIFRSIGRKRR